MDYWSKNHHWMPTYPICCVNGMTRDKYEYIYCHFHCNCATDDDFISSTDDDDEQDRELTELQVERVQRDHEAEIGDDENPNLAEDTPDTEELKVWYEKINQTFG